MLLHPISSTATSRRRIMAILTPSYFALKLVAMLKIKLPANPAISQENAAAELPL